MGGDLFEILFVIAFILFGILGGRKKKPDARPTRRPRPEPRPRPDRRPERVQRAGQDAILRELEALLGGRRPEPPAPRPAPMPADLVPDPDEARSLETLEVEETAAWEEGLERSSSTETARWLEGTTRRAATLETLEGAGEASHERFHGRYELSAPARVTRRQGPDFDLQDVRRAIVWAEILGPPVSLR